MGKKQFFDHNEFDKLRNELNRYKSALKMIDSLYPKDTKIRDNAQWEIIALKMAAVTQAALDNKRL